MPKRPCYTRLFCCWEVGVQGVQTQPAPRPWAGDVEPGISSTVRQGTFPTGRLHSQTLSLFPTIETPEGKQKQS